MRKIVFTLFVLVGLVAAQAHDRDAMKYFNLGLAGTATPKKIKYFTQALMLNPNLADAYEKRGLLYFFQEKYDQVVHDFQRYIKLMPAKSEGYRMLGLGYLKRNEYEQAIDNFTRAIGIKPDIAHAYVNRAEAFRRSARYEDAIRDATRAIELWGDPRTMADAYRTRARAYRKIGKKTEAYNDNLKSVALDPRIWYVSARSANKRSHYLKNIAIMGLFILNGTLFLFLFERRPGFVTFDRYFRRHSRIDILSSKLLATQISDTITRPRLYPLLAEIPRKRLTTVIAGAGYGKSTLIAQAGSYLNLNMVWYRLAPSDREFAAFLGYLAAGIQKFYPGFGAETFRWLTKRQNLEQNREAVLTIFLKEVEKFASKDMMIVLDDYHTMQSCREISLTLQFLIAHLPPEIHLIIISRRDIDLPLFRLRAAREMIDINEEDLAFTPDEIELLYSQLFDIFLKKESLEILLRKTEGWVSGLILFYHALRGKKPDEVQKFLMEINGSHKVIFGYLEENVYNLLADEERDFLVKTSILPGVNAEFCNRFLNITNSGDILKNLENRHLFTIACDEGNQWYAYHHLFREFLHNKLIAEHGEQTALDLYTRAAGLLKGCDENEGNLQNGSNAKTLIRSSRLPGNIERENEENLILLPKTNKFLISEASSTRKNDIGASPCSSLKVYFFGKFRVFQGNFEIPDKRWKSRKAQMLFKYMLASKHRGYIKKDVLMELLWPEDDPVKTAKRFHVALASLRKILEPGIQRGTPSTYISRAGDAYCVDTGDGGWVDIEQFKDELQRAKQRKDPEKSIPHYISAATVYTGDFLEEDLYTPWCDDKREVFKEAYLHVVAKIIQYYEKHKDYSACVDYAGRYLRVDKYAENIYGNLMQYYAEIGNKGMVIRTYERCRESITRDLDVPLSPETEALYRKLVSA